MADVTRSVVVSPPSPQAEALAAVMGLVASLSHVVADASPASGPAAAGGVTRTMLLRFARGLLAVSDASLLSPPLLASLGSSLFSSQVPDLRRALKEDLPRILCAGAATGAMGAAASMDSEEERSVGALAGDCLAELFSQTRALSLSTACEGRTPAVSASGPDVVLDARLCALAAGAPGNEVLRSFASLNCLAVALTGALASLSPGALASTRWPSAEMDAERLPGGRAAAAVVVHLVDCVVGISRLQSSHLGTWPGSPEVAAASVASAGRVARFWVQRLAQTARGCRAGAAASAGVLACALTELEALVAEAEQRGASRVSDNVDAAATAAVLASLRGSTAQLQTLLETALISRVNPAGEDSLTPCAPTSASTACSGPGSRAAASIVAAALRNGLKRRLPPPEILTAVLLRLCPVLLAVAAKDAPNVEPEADACLMERVGGAVAVAVSGAARAAQENAGDPVSQAAWAAAQTLVLRSAAASDLRMPVITGPALAAAIRAAGGGPDGGGWRFVSGPLLAALACTAYARVELELEGIAPMAPGTSQERADTEASLAQAVVTLVGALDDPSAAAVRVVVLLGGGQDARRGPSVALTAEAAPCSLAAVLDPGGLVHAACVWSTRPAEMGAMRRALIDAGRALLDGEKSPVSAWAAARVLGSRHDAAGPPGPAGCPRASAEPRFPLGFWGALRGAVAVARALGHPSLGRIPGADTLGLAAKLSDVASAALQLSLKEKPRVSSAPFWTSFISSSRTALCLDGLGAAAGLEFAPGAASMGPASAAAAAAVHHGARVMGDNASGVARGLLALAEGAGLSSPVGCGALKAARKLFLDQGFKGVQRGLHKG